MWDALGRDRGPGTSKRTEAEVAPCLLIREVIQGIRCDEREAFLDLFTFLQMRSEHQQGQSTRDAHGKYEAWSRQYSRVPLKRTTSGVPVSFAFFLPCAARGGRSPER